MDVLKLITCAAAIHLIFHFCQLWLINLNTNKNPQGTIWQNRPPVKFVLQTSRGAAYQQLVTVAAISLLAQVAVQLVVLPTQSKQCLNAEEKPCKFAMVSLFIILIKVKRRVCGTYCIGFLCDKILNVFDITSKLFLLSFLGPLTCL